MIDPPPLFRAQSTPTAQDRKNESSDLRISEHLEFKHLGSPENSVQTLGVPNCLHDLAAKRPKFSVQTLGVPNCLHDLAAKRPGKFPFKHLGSPEIFIQTLGVEENRIKLNSESSNFSCLRRKKAILHNGYSSRRMRRKCWILPP